MIEDVSAMSKVYGRLDEGRVVAALRQARVGDTAADTVEDIELFLHPRRAR